MAKAIAVANDIVIILDLLRRKYKTNRNLASYSTVIRKALKKAKLEDEDND